MRAYKTSQGNWQVNFSEKGKQKTLYLGRDFTSGSADRVARIVTDILSCRNRGDSVPLEICRKIETLPERVQQSFERLGLTDGITGKTLADLLKSVYESKAHLKLNTQYAYKRFGNLLLEFFGKDKKIAAVQKIDCERFRAALLKTHSDCTVCRGIRRCRTIFKFAVDAEWLAKNPFAGISGSAEVNLDRQVYVDRKTIYRVMEHCRDDYDRLLLALARFGGLRIPSEVRLLRFSDFKENVILIHQDTKTGAREVPLFGEIREIVNRIQAGLGENYKSSDLVFGNLGDFRKRIISAIRSSGVEQWCKLFINLRSSCITDFLERGYTEKALDSVFGNSAAIRRLHYVQFRKEREAPRRRSLADVLRKGNDENDIFSMENEQLLVLRDLLERISNWSGIVLWKLLSLGCFYYRFLE